MPTPNIEGTAELERLKADMAILREGAPGPDDSVIATAELEQFKANAERIPALESELAALREDTAGLAAVQAELALVTAMAEASKVDLEARQEADRIRERDDIIRAGGTRITAATVQDVRDLGDQIGNERLRKMVSLMPEGKTGPAPIRGSSDIPEGTGPRDQQDIARMAAAAVERGEYPRRSVAMAALSELHPDAARITHAGSPGVH